MSPETKAGVAVWGASGRMGSEVVRLLESHPQLELVQAVASPDSRKLGRIASGSVALTAAGPLDPRARVVVDFSTPASMEGLLKCALAAGCPVVSGTTGLDASQKQ